MHIFIWTWLFDDGSLLEQQVPAADWDCANANASAALGGMPNARSVTVEVLS